MNIMHIILAIKFPI